MLPALEFWDTVIDVFHPSLPVPKPHPLEPSPDGPRNAFDVDWVPISHKGHPRRAELVILEDNEAVIKMSTKGRSIMMRHVSRTHRVDLRWLFERLIKDPVITIKYVNTKDQLADILTKGSFTKATWEILLGLIQMKPHHGSQFNAKQSKLRACTAVCNSPCTHAAPQAYSVSASLSPTTRFASNNCARLPYLPFAVVAIPTMSDQVPPAQAKRQMDGTTDDPPVPKMSRSGAFSRRLELQAKANANERLREHQILELQALTAAAATAPSGQTSSASAMDIDQPGQTLAPVDSMQATSTDAPMDSAMVPLQDTTLPAGQTGSANTLDAMRRDIDTLLASTIPEKTTLPAGQMESSTAIMVAPSSSLATANPNTEAASPNALPMRPRYRHHEAQHAQGILEDTRGTTPTSPTGTSPTTTLVNHRGERMEPPQPPRRSLPECAFKVGDLVQYASDHTGAPRIKSMYVLEVHSAQQTVLVQHADGKSEHIKWDKLIPESISQRNRRLEWTGPTWNGIDRLPDPMPTDQQGDALMLPASTNEQHETASAAAAEPSAPPTETATAVPPERSALPTPSSPDWAASEVATHMRVDLEESSDEEMLPAQRRSDGSDQGQESGSDDSHISDITVPEHLRTTEDNPRSCPAERQSVHCPYCKMEWIVPDPPGGKCVQCQEPTTNGSLADNETTVYMHTVYVKQQHGYAEANIFQWKNGGGPRMQLANGTPVELLSDMDDSNDYLHICRGTKGCCDFRYAYIRRTNLYCPDLEMPASEFDLKAREIISKVKIIRNNHDWKTEGWHLPLPFHHDERRRRHGLPVLPSMFPW